MDGTRVSSVPARDRVTHLFQDRPRFNSAPFEQVSIERVACSVQLSASQVALAKDSNPRKF